AEVILIDAGKEGTSPLEGADHPSVTTVKMAQSAGFGALKAAGVRRARGSIVIFLEDHAEARPGWLQAALEAASGPWAAIGAEVHNANAGVGLSDSIVEIIYGLWAPPMQRGEATILAGNNTIYRKGVLQAYDGQLDELLLSDTVLQSKLAADGHRLLTDPKVSISHRNPTTLRSGVTAEFYYHWCFGAVRARFFHWTSWHRFRYLILSPLIPWIRLWRLAKQLLARRQLSSASFLLTILTAIVLLHAAVIGQALGIVLGLGGGLERFTRFELNGPRPLQSD
ncbi:MAG: hypothetical protein A2V88_03620, partial [Elusimicrobia bacterium RBG_16_66_12]